MPWLVNLLMVVQVLSALGVILLVLLQHGKGADMGAAFGGGASGSLFRWCFSPARWCWRCTVIVDRPRRRA